MNLPSLVTPAWLAAHLAEVRVIDARWRGSADPREVRARALAAGLRPEQRIITCCGIGISASLTLFALHLAGFSNLALYDGSWEAWGTDPQRPIEDAP